MMRLQIAPIAMARNFLRVSLRIASRVLEAKRIILRRTKTRNHTAAARITTTRKATTCDN